ncbi:MAG: PEP-CTERM sorting domain-containing protein, partial [Candidatus Acidiferrales bacterium]
PSSLALVALGCGVMGARRSKRGELT